MKLSGKGFYRLLFISGILSLVLLSGLGSMEAESVDNKKSKTIQWSQKEINIEGVPGLPSTVEVQFESNVSLSNVSLWVVPELQPFISVTPSNFQTVGAGTSYSVDINVTVPFNSEPAYYEGTLHLRGSSGTLPETLKVKLTIPANENYIKPVIPSKIVEDDGMVYPVNQVLVVLKEGYSKTDAENIASTINGKVAGVILSLNLYQLEVPAESISELNIMISTIKSDYRVIYVLKNIGLTDDVVRDTGYDINDLDIDMKNEYELVRLTKAWDFINTNNIALTRTTVGIIEIGVEEDHIDLGSEGGVSIFATDFKNEWQFICSDGCKFNEYKDAFSHGTAVTGIIAGLNNNSSMNGILSGVKNKNFRVIVAEKNVDYNFYLGGLFLKITFTSDDINAIETFARAGIKVINMSFGCTLNTATQPDGSNITYPQGLCNKDEFDNHVAFWKSFFTRYPKTLFVASAGNANTNSINHFPGGIPGIDNLITVAAVTSEDKRAEEYIASRNYTWGSGYGDSVNIAAPGFNVYVPDIDNLAGLTPKNGTSLAAPFVTGAAALLFAMKEDITPVEVKRILIDTGDKITTDELLLRKPRLNVYRSIKCAQNPSSCIGDKIVFYSNRNGNYEIYVMNVDGTNQTRLTNNSANDSDPVWSPDGSKIIFESDRDGNYEIYVMNADGTNQTRLTNNSASDFQPSWSPNGAKIAFRTNRDGNDEIYVMNADGTNPVNLTNNFTPYGSGNYYNDFDGEPHWSPDGSKIVFSSWRSPDARVWVMNADGTNQTRLTSITWSGYPRWSPDGSKISYSAWGGLYVMNADGTGSVMIMYNSSGISPMVGSWSPDGTKVVLYSNHSGNYEIYTMNADGSNLVRLTNNSANDLAPYWSP